MSNNSATPYGTLPPASPIAMRKPISLPRMSEMRARGEKITMLTAYDATFAAVADAAGIGRHLKFLGVITNPSELASAYECASLHVFPVRCIPGDPEGFGMVAIEAAAHGVPTIAFATGGVVDAVSQGQSGALVAPDDYAGLAREVLAALERGPDAWHSGAVNFARQFAWPMFGAQLASALKS